jgi:hypothetical protein
MPVVRDSTSVQGSTWPSRPFLGRLFLRVLEPLTLYNGRNSTFDALDLSYRRRNGWAMHRF